MVLIRLVYKNHYSPSKFFGRRNWLSNVDSSNRFWPWIFQHYIVLLHETVTVVLAISLIGRCFVYVVCSGLVEFTTITFGILESFFSVNGYSFKYFKTQTTTTINKSFIAITFAVCNIDDGFNKTLVTLPFLSIPISCLSLAFAVSYLLKWQPLLSICGLEVCFWVLWRFVFF